MSDPVLSQLVAVEADLAQQVETLEAKLNQLQAQHLGLRTVIDMFQESDSGEPDEVEVVEPAPQKNASDNKKTAAEKTTAKKTAAKKTTAAKKSAVKTAAKAKSGSKPGKKTAGRKKRDGRAANWQKYVKSDYRDVALPESVSSVLRAEPSEIFTIADVMSSIFSEEMPRTSYLKARNRISNILSAGARDGTWYRGRNGRYSQSESVTKAK